MHRFIDSSYSLTNSAQESVFARLKYVKHENSTTKPENVESLTLWRYNKLQEWLSEKTDDERNRLILHARSLTNSIKKMHAENAKKVQEELEQEFFHISEEKKKEDRLSMRYCNLISSDKKSFFLYSSDQVDGKRKNFNEEIGTNPNNKVLFFTALCRLLNNCYMTTIRSPKEIGMTVTKAELEIKEFLDNFNFEEEVENCCNDQL